MKKVLLFILISLFSNSCSHFKNNNDSGYEPIWSYNFNVGYFLSIEPILYNNKVIYSGLDEKKNDFSANSTLEALDRETGEHLWQWDETVEDSYDQFNMTGNNYIYNNNLFISTGVDYKINLMSGTTTSLLYDRPRYDGQDFYGFLDNIYSVYSDGYRSSILMKSKTSSYSWEEVISFQNLDSNSYHLQFVLFDEKNNIILPFSTGRLGNGSSIGILRLNNSEIISDTAFNSFEENSFVDFPPIIEDENIYMSVFGQFTSINLNDLSINWIADIYGNASRSGFTIDEENVYVNTEFELSSISKEDGTINWVIPSFAGSRLVVHKGVIYFISGGELLAIESSTGDILEEIVAPSRANDDGAFFQSIITLDAENDRIYTASYTHAYCYPTIR